MAHLRRRMIDPEFFADEKVASCSETAQIVFAGLWCMADREGRLEDRPAFIKGCIRPYSDCDMNAVLDELRESNLIYRYEVDGKFIIQVRSWSKFQAPHKNEQQSKLSTYPGKSSETFRQVPGKNIQVDDRRRQVPSKSESDSKSDSKSESDTTAQRPPQAEAPRRKEEFLEPDEVFLEYPTDGDPKVWQLSKAKVEEWKETYQTIDVEKECRFALQWLRDQPTRQKTARGMTKFLNGWLNRSVNRPNNGSQPSPFDRFGKLKEDPVAPEDLPF